MCGSWGFKSASLLSILNFVHLYFLYDKFSKEAEAYSEPCQTSKRVFVKNLAFLHPHLYQH